MDGIFGWIFAIVAVVLCIFLEGRELDDLLIWLEESVAEFKTTGFFSVKGKELGWDMG